MLPDETVIKDEEDTPYPTDNEHKVFKEFMMSLKAKRANYSGLKMVDGEELDYIFDVYRHDEEEQYKQ